MTASRILTNLRLTARRLSGSGVLLPLSGEASRYGQGLKKAALMALEDMNNPNLILQFYDTQSSPKAQEPPPKTLLTKKRR